MAADAGSDIAVAAPPAPPRGRLRTGIAAGLTVLALLVVWVRPRRTGSAQPPHARRVRAAPARRPRRDRPGARAAGRDPTASWPASSGPCSGLLVIVKILDMGFFEAFDRPFDPIADGSYTGIGIETLRDSIGRTEANLVVVGAAAARHRRARPHDPGGAPPDPRRRRPPPLVAAGGHGARRRLGALLAVGAQLVSYAPIASTSAAGLVSHEVRAVQAGVEDHAVFADEIRHDRFRDTPAARLLTACAARTSCSSFVESYGKVAVTGLRRSRRRSTPCSTQGTTRLQAAGFAARSGFLTSSDVRRAQLARALHPAVGGLGRQPAALRPARQDRPPDAQRRVQAGRLAHRRRRAVEQPDLAAGVVVLPLRQALRPAQRRLSRPAVLVRLDARPVRPRWPCSASSSRSATAARSSRRSTWCRATRRGRASRTMIGWNDVGDGSIYKQHAGRRPDAVRALRRPRAGARGLRPVDRVHAERPGLVRAALRRQEPRARRPRRPPARRRSSPARARATTCRSRSSPTTRRCSTGSPGGAGTDGLRPEPATRRSGG